MKNKISLIIRREYISRVKKKTFVVMTIIGPVLFAALLILPSYLATKTDETKQVNVVDETGIYKDKMSSSKAVEFNFLDKSIAKARNSFHGDSADALLYIPITKSSRKAKAVLLYRDNQPSLTVQEHVKNEINNLLEQSMIKAEFGIDPGRIKGLKPNVSLSTRNMQTGEESMALLTSGLGFVGGILIYFFIFLFGSQVMRGVLEEKTNRIVEVIVSSIRPFQLMMGKIVGVALVGLTQFLLWVMLTFIIVSGVQIANPGLLDPSAGQPKVVEDTGTLMPDDKGKEKSIESFEAEDGVAAVASGLQSINVPLMLLSFLFYFLFGYLLYAALFAAVGSAVDNEADTQQFMLPITIPLLLAIVLSSFVVQSPEGPVAFWLSVIPFTSPVVMMIRIPFGVDVWQVALSMGLLVMTFLGVVWMSGKIYRTGILMYGKKINYRELWKWLRHSG